MKKFLKVASVLFNALSKADVMLTTTTKFKTSLPALSAVVWFCLGIKSQPLQLSP